jgi:hypothetical protein
MKKLHYPPSYYISGHTAAVRRWKVSEPVFQICKTFKGPDPRIRIGLGPTGTYLLAIVNKNNF